MPNVEEKMAKVQILYILKKEPLAFGVFLKP